MNGDSKNMEDHISKEIKWVKRFYPGGGELRPKELSHILAFGIIWNIFESLIKEDHPNHKTYDAIDLMIQENSDRFVRRSFLDEFMFFSTRYNGLDIASALHFNNLKRAEVVRSAIQGDVDKLDTDKIVLALCYIVNQLRNNLYHGKKSFHSLPSQNESFEHANSVLIKIIDSTQRSF
jgi:hypothetical protein